jgi:hypothetical protein
MAGVYQVGRDGHGGVSLHVSPALATAADVAAVASWREEMREGAGAPLGWCARPSCFALARGGW